MGIHHRRFLREQDRKERRTHFYSVATIMCLCALIVLFICTFATRADAASLQVYPNATYTHGGQIFPKDMSSSLTVDGSTQQGGGVERYTFPGGSYSVQYKTPAGYRATLGDGCSGTAGPDDDITCQVYVVDGAPIELPQAPAQQDVPQVVSGGGYTPAPDPVIESAPIPEPPRIIEITSTSSPTVQTESGTTTTIVVIKEVVREVPVVVTSTTTDAALTQIAAKQDRLESLLEAIYNLVQWIVDSLRAVWGWTATI